MNHIYHSIWNEALGTWIAVSEIAKGQGKRSSNRRKNPMTASSLKDWQSSTPLLATSLFLFSSVSWALPTGNELVAGQAAVSNPTAGQMQIDQTSQNAIVNWQGFSIAPNEAVNIHQPNAQAALLNRVVGQDASQIQGQLNATGQVYLVNPNGVIFGKTAQVDVGGLVASTHDITNQDFMNGKAHFTQNGATGTVENHGTIKTPEGGVVALIGEKVSNTGTINTPKGTTALAAGKTVDLDFKGDGLVEVKVSEAALNAQISNHGAILADAGRVVLTAKAAGQLIDTVINQDGIIQAQGLVERNGEIILDGGDNGTVKVTGTLDTRSPNLGLNAVGENTNQGLNASGGNITVKGANIQLANGATINASGNTGGGTITIGDKQTTHTSTIDDGATATTQTLNSGTAGTINVLANMDSGTVNVAGKLDASASGTAKGGFVETSASHVKVTDSAKISTHANTGKTGGWLIDPTDYTIGTDITGATLASNLGTSNVTIASTQGASAGNGDIFINDTVSYTSANSLTLNAIRNVTVNQAISNTGLGSVNLRADMLGACVAGAGACGTINFAGAGHITASTTNLYYNPTGSNNAVDANGVGSSYATPTNYSANVTGTLNAYMLINDVNQLQGINTNLAGMYALGKDIDASATSGWNFNGTINQGFLPLGDLNTFSFTGQFNGLGHTITGLSINRPSTDYVGLFGYTQGSTISNVGLVGGNITGGSYVGGLVGYSDYFNDGGFVAPTHSITNVYATNSVTGVGYVGGLVGVVVLGSISNSYATGNVTATGNFVGGLAGAEWGVCNISSSYATGSVSGNSVVGGLVGTNYSAISSSYATGKVTATGDYVGGLSGINAGIINNSYATGSVSGNDTVGGLVGDNGDPRISSSGSISNAYATGSVSGIGNNVGGLVGVNENFNGTINNSFWNTDNNAFGRIGIGSGSPSTTVFGKTTTEMQQAATFSLWGTDISATGGSLAIWRIYEGNVAPLLRSFLTPLTVAADNITKIYNGLSDSVLSNPNYTNTSTGAVITPNSNLLGTATPYGTAKNVGTYAVTGLFSSQQGYDISNGTSTLTINKADLSLSGSRSYDGSKMVAGNTLTATGVAGETFSVTGTGDTSNLASKNVQTNSLLASLIGLSLGTSSNGGAVGNYNALSTTGSTFSVNKADLSLSGSRTYNGSKIVAGNTLIATGAAGETFTVTGTGDTSNLASKDVQTNSLLASLTGLSLGTSSNGGAVGNYNALSTTGSAFTINKAALAINANAVTKTYDGTLSATGTGTVGTLAGAGDSVLSAGIQAFLDKKAGIGNKTVRASGVTIKDATNTDVTGNYAITYTDNLTSTINPANLTVTANFVTKFYDGTLSATGTGTVGTIAGAGDAVLNAGIQTYLDKNVGIANKVVRASGVTIKDTTNTDVTGNYAITYIDNNVSTIIQTALNVTVTANTVTKTYDGTTTATGTGTVSNITGVGDSVLSAGIQAFLDKNVGIGNKTVRASGVTIKDTTNTDVTGNYIITYIDNTTSTINKADLSLSGSRIYDGSKMVAGNTLIATGVANETFAVTGVGDTSNLASKNIQTNSQLASLTGLNLGTSSNGGAAGNYNALSTIGSTFTINKAALAVNANTVTKTYDGTLSANGTGTVGTIAGAGDAVLSAGIQTYLDKNVGIGNKTVRASGVTIKDTTNTDVTGNYAITYIDNMVSTINPAILTYTANAASQVYGTTNPTFSGTVTGFVNGELQADVTTGTALYQSTANNLSAVGQYAINGSGLIASNGNYNFVQAASNSSALSIIAAIVPPVIPLVMVVDTIPQIATLQVGITAGGQQNNSVDVVTDSPSLSELVEIKTEKTELETCIETLTCVESERRLLN